MFQITLRTARELCGYTIEDILKYSKLSLEACMELEGNTELLDVSHLRMIKKLLPISLDLIYIGKETDCINHNRVQIKRSGSKVGQI